MNLYVVTLIYSTITLAALFVYFPLVWLNATFTFAYLPASSVPFYASSSADTPGLPQYGWTWWFLALDLLRFLPIYYIFIVLSIPKRYAPAIKPKEKRTQLTLGWNILLGFLGAIEAIKAVAFGIMALNALTNFANCFDTADNCTNYIYVMALVSSILFCLWDFIWIWGAGTAINEYIMEKKE